MAGTFLQDIQSFDEKRRLKSVETVVTTPSGKRYIEKAGDIVNVEVAKGLGFCPDLEPDYNVGVAMPGLLIASADVACDLSALKKNQITHILNVAAGLPNAFDDEFVYLSVQMYDDLDEVIMNHYPLCEKFINDALNQNGVVLIHCRAGRSRSVSIAVAYLILQKGMSFEEALDKIKETRPNADPNTAFLTQLRQIGNKLNY